MPDDLFELLMGVQAETECDRETYIRAPFGWPGGKSQSLKYIIPLLKRGKVFVDGCGGSGIITLNAPNHFPLRVFNDRHSGVVAFYRCIRDPVKVQLLVNRLELGLHSREEFVWCRDSWTNCQDDIERAARWYYMLRMSFGQLGRNFGRSIAGTNMLAKKYHTALEDFPAFHQNFKDVQIENLDVNQCIRDYDSKDTVFYIDPDYIGADPGIYQNRVDHARLMETIKEADGFFIVSGYDNSLYNSYSWDDKKQWDVTTPISSQSFLDNSLQDKRNVMTRDRKAKETIWIRENK